MEGPEAAEDVRRCPSCGALVSRDAAWCGQCYTSLLEPEPEPEPVPLPAAPSDGAPGASNAGREARDRDSRPTPTWPCPVCGNDNAIDLDVCIVCGTPFATLMRTDEQPAAITPQEAFTASLIFPGRGHRKVGRAADGFARGVLFVVVLVLAVLLASSGLHTPSLLVAFLLFATLTIVVYLGTALEAYRLAEGGELFVSSRALLWATVAVIFVGVGFIAISAIGAMRR